LTASFHSVATSRAVHSVVVDLGVGSDDCLAGDDGREDRMGEKCALLGVFESEQARGKPRANGSEDAHQGWWQLSSHGLYLMWGQNGLAETREMSDYR